MYGDDKTVINVAVPEGRYYGNQLILEHFGRRQNRPPSLVALASETECTNALWMHDLIAALMPLYRVKFW